MSRRAKKEILVSWLPTLNGAAPILTVIAEPKSPLYGAVDELVLCYQEHLAEGEHARVFADTVAAVKALPPELAVELRLAPWKSRAAPTDHGKILEFAKEVLREIREREPDARINIQLSTGTKAMHAIWLTLAHGSFVGGDVRLLQTSEAKHQERGAKPVEFVKLPQETWAHIVRSSAPARDVEGNDAALWELGRVESGSAKATLADVDRWAPLPAPILLIGERGTGKTTLAHTIRARSPFRALDNKSKAKDDKHWPVVVCGQFRANPQLARSELFGHTRGAFTGADAERVGILEQVSGDTLFLDEIADLDRGTQRLLIAAIEGRDFHRLGNEVKAYKANFRLIAATNRQLDSLVLGDAVGDAASGIDADFFDRISTFIIRIPPLRERREDLPQLWRSVLREAAQRCGLGADALSAVERDRKVLEHLDAHDLPGNIRDLQRAAWRAVAAILADEKASAVTRAAVDGLEPAYDTAVARGSVHLPLDIEQHLDAERRRVFEAALDATNGNKSQAAKLVGLARKTFESQLARLGR